MQVWKRLKRHTTFIKLKILLSHYNIAHIVLRNSIRDWYRLIASNFRDRKDALLIRLLPKDVAWRAVLAHQNAEWMTTTIGGPATDRGRSPPDHLRVMP